MDSILSVSVEVGFSSLYFRQYLKIKVLFKGMKDCIERNHACVHVYGGMC